MQYFSNRSHYHDRGVEFFQYHLMIYLHLSTLWWFPFRHRATPSHHPFKNGIFTHKPSISGYSPWLWKPPCGPGSRQPKPTKNLADSVQASSMWPLSGSSNPNSWKKIPPDYLVGHPTNAKWLSSPQLEVDFPSWKWIYPIPGISGVN